MRTSTRLLALLALVAMGEPACNGQGDSSPVDPKPAADEDDVNGAEDGEENADDSDIAGGQSGGQSDPPEFDDDPVADDDDGLPSAPSTPTPWWGIAELDNPRTPSAFLPVASPLSNERPELTTHAGVVYGVTPSTVFRVAEGQLETLMVLNRDEPAPRLQVADLGGDAAPELVLSSRRTVAVWAAKDGTYEAVWSAPFTDDGNADPPLLIDDLDQDGSLDLIAGSGGSLRWYRGDGGLGFSEQVVESDPLDETSVWCQALFVADLDGDGDRDLLGVYFVSSFAEGENHDTFLAVFANEGDSTRFVLAERQSLGTTALPILADALVDLDGDGQLDLVGYSATESGSNFWFSAGTAGGGFAMPELIDTGKSRVGGELRIVTGDLDGDGVADLVLSEVDGTVLLFGDGDGGFSRRVLPANLGTPSSAVLRQTQADTPPTLVAVLTQESFDVPPSCEAVEDCLCVFEHCAECVYDEDCGNGVCVATSCEECVEDSHCDETEACIAKQCRQVVSRVDDWAKVVTGYYGTGCGVRESGELSCWGYEELELPNGSFADVAIYDSELGGGCALRTDGSVTCWPSGYTSEPAPELEGQFQALSGDYSLCGLEVSGGVRCLTGTPPTGTDFVQVSAGSSHACGLHEDGTAECWPLGDGGNSAALNPPATAYSALGSGAQHSCGVREEDGGIECWGRNNYSQASPPGGSFTAVDAGDLSSCGLTTDGSIHCWGSDSWQPSGEDFVALTVTASSACALQSNGAMQCSYPLE